MTDAERIVHARAFFKALNENSPASLSAAVNEEVGQLLLATLAAYSDASVEACVKTTTANDAKEIAAAMLTIGYMLRASEERKAAPLPLTGTYRH